MRQMPILEIDGNQKQAIPEQYQPNHSFGVYAERDYLLLQHCYSYQTDLGRIHKYYMYCRSHKKSEYSVFFFIAS